MAMQPVKTVFTNMSFTPDVPSSALQATEYNAGYNVETDVRSVKSVLGDQFILTAIPGNNIFTTGGFRNNDVFWFISATEQGFWYAQNQNGSVANITPSPITGVITSNTTFTSVSGTSSSTAAGTYTAVTPVATSGNGTQATFNIQILSDSVPYNGVGAIGPATTFTTITGNVGNVSQGVYSNIAPVGTSGSGSGARFGIVISSNTGTYANVATITAVNGGHNYAVNDTITILGNTIGGNLTNNLTFTVSSVVSNVTTITDYTGGKGYAPGDTITIAGNVLNGNYASNLTFTLGGTVSTINIGNFGAGVYTPNTVITASWNGSTLFLNDQVNPPMYLTGSSTELGVFGYPDPETDQIYVWNYDVTTTSSGNIIPLYSSLTAGFTRVYNSPNVGTLLIAGNLTGVVAANVTNPVGGTIQNLPTTVRWSQNFGLNSGPLTWAPTLTNVANEVEVPVRGPVIDGFALNGNFYVFSYWDCVQFSPIAYTSTTAPIFGILLVTQGRGLLNENCWAIQDATAYGVDSRDIWSFNGGTFTPIGDQRVKNYFFNNLNAAYTNQVFMINNTEKYQIEIYYPDVYSTGQCNSMLSYRYDLNVWNPPRQVTKATAATEAPRFYGGVPNLATRGVVYSSFTANSQLIQKDAGTSFVNNTPISTLFERDNISFGQAYSASVLVHRVYPEIYGTGNINITVGGADSVANAATYQTTVSMPIQTSDPWVQIDQNEARITSIQFSSSSTTNTWQLTAANWQVTQVQDTR